MTRVSKYDPRLDHRHALENIQPGQEVVYYRGVLARLPNDIGDIAKDLYYKGVLTLVQRKIGPDDYDYIAQGVKPGEGRRRKPTPGWFNLFSIPSVAKRASQAPVS